MCEKVQYLTYKLAKDAALKISIRDKQSMSPYKCDECRQFHLKTNGKKQYIGKKHEPKTMFTERRGIGVVSPIPKQSKPQSFIHTTTPLISKEFAFALKAIIKLKNGNNEKTN